MLWSTSSEETSSLERDVVPSDYSNFFDAASQAAGALIGLLFVVIALKPGKILGPRAEPAFRRLAASSFTGLVNSFFVSLLALIPGQNLGIGAAIMAPSACITRYDCIWDIPLRGIFSFSLLACLRTVPNWA